MPRKSHLISQQFSGEEGIEYENIEIFYDSEGFAVTSDPEFLFRMGKMCAESGRFLEEGLLCLDDYLNIINFSAVEETDQIKRIKT